MTRIKTSPNIDKQLDKILPQDFAIFKKATDNANFFTDYYLRTPTSGTFWKAVPEPLDEERSNVWKAMYDRWMQLGSPKDSVTFSNSQTAKTYKILKDELNRPIFHDHHGWLWMPWQLKVHHCPQPDVTVLGGFGCIAAETKIEGVTVKTLFDNQIAPMVSAWTGNKFVRVQATVPFIKGTTNLYKVVTKSGREITVTNQHRFLTRSGYKPLLSLVPGDILLISAATPLESIQEFGQSIHVLDVQRLTETPEDSQLNYHRVTHLCDEQPQLGLETVANGLPLQGDALEHNPPYLHMGDRGYESEYTRFYQQFSRHSKHRFVRLVVRRDALKALSPVGESTDAVAPLQQAKKAALQFVRNSSPEKPTILLNRNIDQGSNFFSPALNYPVLLDNPYASKALISKSAEFQQQVQQRSSFHVAQIMDQDNPALNVTNFDVAFIKSSDNDYITGDEIMSISFIRKDVFYDLHVPVYENYLAEGFINHNSGKTSEIAMSLLTLAATIPHFRGFAVAPQMLQSMEVYNYIMTWAKGTPYWDRWVVSYPKKPYPRIVIQNSYVGESTIELLSIEHDPEKVRTLEGDIIYLDQAEKFQDLDALTRDLGSRLRGQVHGRARLGKLIFIANAGDNPELWYRYDMAETNPETYLSMTVTSYDNIWLSKRDLESLERRVGGTQEEIAQWMKGIRPIGNGEHFPSSVIKLNLDEGLTNVVQYQTELPEGHPDKKPGFVLKKANRVGVYHWEMPPEKNRVYIVIADPGQSNPPDRNSAIIMVWDVTDFPSQPARLQAFNWVFCNGSYWPFVTAFEDYVKRYNAKGRNGFDSTGTQTGFNELVFATMSLETEGINLAAQGKYLALNAAKFFMGRGMMKIPYIEHLVNQLSHYRLPDAKLKQDLVMCIAMSAAYMRRYYYEDMPDIEGLVKPSSKQQTYDRHIRGVGNRYERTSR